jgi:hypothetical protein
MAAEGASSARNGAMASMVASGNSSLAVASATLRYATLRCPISALGPISTAITSLNSVSFTYATGARPLVGRSSAQPLLIGVQRFG